MALSTRVDALIEVINRALSESQRLAENWQQQQVLITRYAQLSVRENEVLNLLVEGLTSKAIARKLDLSPRTVEAHRAAILTKSGANSLAQLIRDYQRLQTQ